MNVVAIMGRLTYEPELRVTPSNVSVLRFQIAVDRSYTPKNQERQADFIDCVAWRSTAEFISRYFHKGQMIALTGSIQTGNYTDKNGEQRKAVDVVVNEASFCGSKSESNPQLASAQPPQYTAAPNYASADASDFEEIIDDDDDLPFGRA
jgi:single-strand DNA-binding protein